MSLSEMNAQTAAVLEKIHRGSIDQNLYRMALQQFTMNSLGQRLQISRSPEAIHRAALGVVRRHNPNFAPTIRPS